MNSLRQPTDPEHAAFPGDALNQTCGLTKREYFAAMALQGLLAHGHRGTFAAMEAREAADSLIEHLNRQS